MDSQFVKLNGKRDFLIPAAPYKEEKDIKRAKYDCERLLLMLSEMSIKELVAVLEPYRRKFAEGEDKG